MVKRWSTVWNHFSVSGEDKAKCAYCSAVLSYKGGSTTNFVRHLKSKHLEVINIKRQPNETEENLVDERDSEQQKSEDSLLEQGQPQQPTVRTVLKRRRMGKKWSTVWNHFSIREKEKVKCSYCSAVLAYKGGSTTTFTRHLKTRHPQVLNSRKRTGARSTSRTVLQAVQRQRWVYGTPPGQEDQQSESGTGPGQEEEKPREDGTTAVQEPALISALLVTKQEWIMGTPPGQEDDQYIEDRSTTTQVPTSTSISTALKKNKSVFKRKRMDKRSYIWNHFSDCGDETGKCAYCSSVLSYRGGNTANLVRHLNSKHHGVTDSGNQSGVEILGDFNTQAVQGQTSVGTTAGQEEEQHGDNGTIHIKDNDGITPEEDHHNGNGTTRTGSTDEDGATTEDGDPQSVDETIAGQEPTVIRKVFKQKKLVFKRKKMDKRSTIWNHFSEFGKETGKCIYCSAVLSYKGYSTTNFTRHLKARHPTIMSAKLHTQSEYFSRPMSVSSSRSKVIDEQFVRMVVKEYHPLTLGEETEFRKLIDMLNPNYELPSQKTLCDSLIPQLFEKTKDDVKKHLKMASAVSITTDGWTSITSQNYVAITVHFIDEKCVLRNYLLDCFECSERNSAQDLAEDIQRVFTEWNIENKVVAVVSDNASNIKAAVRLGNWCHVSCFAHSLNFIVQNAIEEIHEVHQKVKAIVEYFEGNTDAMNNLKSIQEEMGDIQPEVELKRDVATCWNSTYDMFVQVLQIKDAILSSMGLVQTTLPQLYPRDWTVIEKACEVLKVFYEVTGELSCEKSVSVSKVLLLSDAMRTCCLNFIDAESNDLPPEVSKMIQEILDQMSYRFMNEEDLPLLSECTLLDPRFKQHAFEDENLFQNAYYNLNEVINNGQNDENASAKQLAPEKQVKKSLIWEEFESKMANVCSNQSSSAAEVNELDSYLQEPNIDRTADPLKWWESRKFLYPRLFNLVKRRLCVAATSVPCERIFSLREHLISERRSMLTSKVSQIYFLNANL